MGNLVNMLVQQWTQTYHGGGWHISNLIEKLGLCLSIFYPNFHMLDNETCVAYYNGSVLQQFVYGDIVEFAEAL